MADDARTPAEAHADDQAAGNDRSLWPYTTDAATDAAPGLQVADGAATDLRAGVEELLRTAESRRWVTFEGAADGAVYEPEIRAVLDAQPAPADEPDLATILDRHARALAVLNGAPIPMGEVRARHAAAILRGDRG